jgi:hypothetical protein
LVTFGPPGGLPITIAAPKLLPQASRANIAGGWAKIATNTHPDGVVFSVSNANVKGRAV